MREEFSVVMSVYRRDDPTQFTQAMDSLLAQSVLPKTIVLAIDGPIDGALKECVDAYCRRSIVTPLVLAKNVGLGASRHQAILAAPTEIIAVMDSDDVNRSDRFERQITQFETDAYDVVGGYISEFIDTPALTEKIRRVPLAHADIVRRGRWIQPINHVTIMFRKTAYLKAGGYRGLRKIEDFDLFHRLCVTGARFRNLPDVLVLVRTSHEQYGRRHGVAYLREEMTLFRDMMRSGYIGPMVFARNISIRLCVRLMPLPLLRACSRTFMRSPATTS